MTELHSAIAVEPIDDTRLRVSFDNGAVGVFDCSPYMKEKYWSRLCSPTYFRRVKVECGMLCWPDDIDIAPEDVWEDSVKVS